MSWQPTYPTHANKVKDVPDLVQSNWVAINKGLSGEHTATGHNLGGSNILWTATTAAESGDPTVPIGAISSPVTGALAFDNIVGSIVYYSGAAWRTLGQDYWSRFRAYISTTTLVCGGQNVKIIPDLENWDTLGEYDATLGTFAPSAAGMYFILGTIAVSGQQTSLNKSCALALSGTGTTLRTVDYKIFSSCSATPYPTLHTSYMGFLSAGEKICLVATNPETATVKFTVVAGCFAAHRLPWSGV
jgi:hypothetical protein